MAPSVMTCSVSLLCWPSSARTFAFEKSPGRRDSALMLKARAIAPSVDGLRRFRTVHWG